MACIDFWNQNTHPIIGDRYHGAGSRAGAPIIYVKTDNFSSEKYIETKELMRKYKINAVDLSEKIRALGYDKVTCMGKKWVDRDIEKHF